MSDPRPGNAGRNDYPRMLFHPDGRTTTVEDAPAHDRLAREGWDTVPGDIHMQRQATPSPAVSGAEPLALMLRSVIEAVLDERGFTKRRKTNGE